MPAPKNEVVSTFRGFHMDKLQTIFAGLTVQQATKVLILFTGLCEAQGTPDNADEYVRLFSIAIDLATRGSR